MKRHIITVAACMLLSSCIVSEIGCGYEMEVVRSHHLINSYHEWSSFRLAFFDRFRILFETEQIYRSAEWQDLFSTPRQTKEQLDMFYKLVVRNGDVGYNWVQHVTPGEKLYTAIHPRITDILITSDHDFDESHPAGTSLNDVFKAYYFSYTQFLGDVDHSDVDTHDQWLGYTEKTCSEIDKRELSVIDPY